MDKMTIFLYLKTIQQMKGDGKKFEHALFHLHRFLRIEKNVRWERLFVFGEDRFYDDRKKRVFRTLAHHDFIDVDNYELLQPGLHWLNHAQKELTELDAHVDEFFAQYKGLFAFQQSCYDTKDSHTLSCHLCEDFVCQREESLLTLLNPLNFVRLKTPSKSFSK